MEPGRPHLKRGSRIERYNFTDHWIMIPNLCLYFSSVHFVRSVHYSTTGRALVLYVPVWKPASDFNEDEIDDDEIPDLIDIDEEDINLM
jgi:hypothetical protein